MQSSFFWRLFASYFLLVLVTTVLIGWMVDRRMSGALEDSHEASLRDKALYLEPFALRVFSGEAGGAEERIGALARASGTRLTLIRADGVVVADSDEDVARMENHANRPEVLAAHGAPFGISRRRSATVGYEMLYVARVLPTGDVVRVALPLRQVHEQVVALRGSIAAVALLALLVSLGLGLIVVRRINRPIAEMTRVAEELRAGVYTRRVRSRTDDELGVLADTLNRLGEEIARRIATISEDRTRLGAVLAGMAESVVAVDREDRVLFCNAAAAKLFEVDPERSVG